LVAVVGPGALDPNDKAVKQALDTAFDRSYLRFTAEWADLLKEAKPNMLGDADPVVVLQASGVRAPSKGSSQTVSVPGLVGGSGSRWSASGGKNRSASPGQSPAARAAAAAQKANDDLNTTLTDIVRYEAAREAGYPGLISILQPSNPRAFVKPPIKAAPRPSGMLNAVLLAGASGLTERARPAPCP